MVLVVTTAFYSSDSRTFSHDWPRNKVSLIRKSHSPKLSQLMKHLELEYVQIQKHASSVITIVESA
jgi:hypothetical protein